MALNPTAKPFHPISSDHWASQPISSVANGNTQFQELIQLNSAEQVRRCSLLDQQSLEILVRALLEDTEHAKEDKQGLMGKFVIFQFNSVISLLDRWLTVDPIAFARALTGMSPDKCSEVIQTIMRSHRDWLDKLFHVIDSISLEEMTPESKRIHYNSLLCHLTLVFPYIAQGFISNRAIERLADVLVSLELPDFAAVAINTFITSYPSIEFVEYYNFFIYKMIDSPQHIQGTPIPALCQFLYQAAGLEWFKDILFKSLTAEPPQGQLSTPGYYFSEPIRNFTLYSLPFPLLCELLRGDPNYTFNCKRAAELTQIWFLQSKFIELRSDMIQKFLEVLQDDEINGYLYELSQSLQGVAISYVLFHIPSTTLDKLKNSRNPIYRDHSFLPYATVTSQEEMTFLLREMAHQKVKTRAKEILNLWSFTYDPASVSTIPPFLLGIGIRYPDMREKLIPLANHLSFEQLRVTAFALPGSILNENMDILENVLNIDQFSFFLKKLSLENLCKYLQHQTMKLTESLKEAKTLYTSFLNKSLNENEGKSLIKIFNKFDRITFLRRSVYPRFESGNYNSVTDPLNQLINECRNLPAYWMINQLKLQYPKIEQETTH